MKKKISIIIAVGLAIGYGIFLYFPKNQSTASAQGSLQTKVHHVEVVSPRRGTVAKKIRLPATVFPWQSVSIFSRVSGYLREVRVEIGDVVENRRLFEMDGIHGKTLREGKISQALNSELAKNDVVLSSKVEIISMSDGWRIDDQGRHYFAIKEGEKLAIYRRDILAIVDAPELEIAIRQSQYQIKEIEEEILRYKAETKRLLAEGKKHTANIARAQANIERVRVSIANAKILEELARAIIDRLEKATKLSPSLVSQDEVDEARRKYELSKGRVLEEMANLKMAETELLVAQSTLKAAMTEEQTLQAIGKSLQAKKEVAMAALKKAEVMRDFATITTPFSGYVTARYVDRGELVLGDGGKGNPLLEIADFSRMRIQFHVSEVDVSFIQTGEQANAVLISIGALQSFRPQATQVKRISQAVDPNTKTMLVELECNNSKDLSGAYLLRPGMFVQVELTLFDRRDCILIPAQALVVENREYAVYVVNKDIVHKQKIEIAYDDGKIVEVSAGLKGDEMIIIAGKNMVAEGYQVKSWSR